MRIIRLVIALSIVFVVGTLPLHAQPGVLWNTTFGGPDDEWATDGTQLADGGFLLTGFTETYGDEYPHDVYVVRTDSDGELVWDYSWGEQDVEEMGCAIFYTPDDIVLVAVQVDPEEPLTDMWVFLALTPEGEFLDDFPFDTGVEYSELNGGVITDSAVVLCGEFQDYFTLMKFDDQLNLIWTQQFGNGEIDNDGFDVIAVDDGYAAIGYNRTDSQEGDQDIWLLRLDEEGELSWDYRYEYATEDEGQTLFLCADGGFLLGCEVSIEEDQEAHIIRTDSNGVPQWTYTLEMDGFQDVLSLYEDDEGYIYTGIVTIVGQDLSGADELFYKFDSDGNVVWSTTYGGDAGDGGAFIPTSDGGFALIGVTSTWGNGDEDFWLLKTESVLNDVDENLVGTLPLDFNVIEAFPNPFNSSVNLSFNLAASGMTEVKVFDVSGRLVGTIVQQYMPHGSQEMNWDAAGLSSGNYFVQLFQEGKTIASRRITYLK